MTLLLASSSTRRYEILRLLGLPVEVIAPDFVEIPSPERAAKEEVLSFAAGKAESVARHNPNRIVIGGDTMILVDGRKLGKPEHVEHARTMLRLLSGRPHRIFTAVAILDDLGGPGLRTVEEVVVKMRPYSEQDIDGYLSCNESLDKAGAYSIQERGQALIESVRGDFLAAVGLPLRPIARYLQQQGIRIPVDLEQIYRNEFLSSQHT